MAEAAEKSDTSGKLVWWILSGLAAIVLTGAGAWATAVHDNIAIMNTKMSERSERLTRVESQAAGLEKRLERIEEKLDEVREWTKRRQ